MIQCIHMLHDHPRYVGLGTFSLELLCSVGECSSY
jgi:hypothetical protein